MEGSDELRLRLGSKTIRVHVLLVEVTRNNRVQCSTIYHFLTISNIQQMDSINLFRKEHK